MRVTILESPFAILGASIRDRRARLNELVDEKEMLLEADECRQARMALTHPRARLRAEIGWFLGVSPQRAAILLKSIKANDIANLSAVGLPPLTAVNVIFSLIELQHEPYSVGLMAQMIRDLLLGFNTIRVEDVFREVNDQRIVSGFPNIPSPAQVTEEIENLKTEYSRVLSGLVFKLDSKDCFSLISQLAALQEDFSVETDTFLFDEIFSAYEISLATFYEQTKSDIDSINHEISDNTANSIASKEMLIDRLEQKLEAHFHKTIALQKILSNKGIDHQPSCDIGFTLRNFSIDLFNEADDEKTSKLIQSLLRKFFGHVPTLSERLQKDAADMEHIRIARLESIIRCDRCQTISPHLRFTIFYRVWSLIFYSRMIPTAGVFCQECRSTLASANATFSVLLGPWGFPWGIFYTIKALYVAAIGGSKPRSENAALLSNQGSAFLRNDMIDEAFTSYKMSLTYEKDDLVQEILSNDVFSSAKLLLAIRMLKGQSIAIVNTAVLTIAICFYFASATHTTNSPSLMPIQESSRHKHSTIDDSDERLARDWKKIRPSLSACRLGDSSAHSTYLGCKKYLAKVRSIKQHYSGSKLEWIELSEDAGIIWLAQADHAQNRNFNDFALYKDSVGDFHHLSIYGSTKMIRVSAKKLYNCYVKNQCSN